MIDYDRMLKMIQCECCRPIDEDANLWVRIVQQKMIEKYEGKTFHCPACDQIHANSDEMIVHLNDYHEWNFDAIADWVEKNQNVEIENRVTGGNNE